MKFYINITLLPDVETNLGFLWQKVYCQLHLALVEMKTSKGKSDIAISFPDYGSKAFPLGSTLRLLALTQVQLQQLDLEKWLSRLTDYCHYTSVKEVPQSVQTYMCFKRVQFDSSIEGLARRRSKRKDQSIEQAMQHYVGYEKRDCKLPFVNMLSLSKRERFKLFISMSRVDHAVQGEFSCYGLSKTATVPWF